RRRRRAARRRPDLRARRRLRGDRGGRRPRRHGGGRVVEAADAQPRGLRRGARIRRRRGCVLSGTAPGLGTFLLGVGCPKSGTEWLHGYLGSASQADFGFRKEYHVWDALDLPSGRLARRRIESQGGERAAFLRDPERYFDHFAGLLEADGIHLTADITPAYAA